MSIETINLSPPVYAYLREWSLREPAILEQLRGETEKLSNYAMQIAPEQGQFMALLMKMINAKKTLEIGTFTGYSALAVALALPEDGRVIACDVNKEWTDVARRYWRMAGVADRIDLRLAPALATLDALINAGEAGTFDFVFIDADKQNYPVYYEKAIELLRSGGLVAVDNVLWGGKVANREDTNPSTVAIRKVNELVYRDDRVELSMLPIGDGLTLARKR